MQEEDFVQTPSEIQGIVPEADRYLSEIPLVGLSEGAAVSPEPREMCFLFFVTGSPNQALIINMQIQANPAPPVRQSVAPQCVTCWNIPWH